jgi:hypothetical protein
MIQNKLQGAKAQKQGKQDFCCVMYVGLHVRMVDYMRVHESM